MSTKCVFHGPASFPARAQLLRAAGGDGTALFDQYHRWVNLEGMLQRCFVGYLVPDGFAARVGASHSASLPERMQDAARTPVPAKRSNTLALPMGVFDAAASQPARLPRGGADADMPKLPSRDWYQSAAHVTVTVYVAGHPTLALGTAVVEPGLVRVTLPGDGLDYVLELRPLHALVAGKFELRRTGNTVALQLSKAEPLHWAALGDVLLEAWQLHRDGTGTTRACEILRIDHVAEHVRLFTLRNGFGAPIPPGHHLDVAASLGHHLDVAASLGAAHAMRPYTPVVPLDGSVMDEHQGGPAARASSSRRAELRLLVKLYAGGAMSRLLSALAVGAVLQCTRMPQPFDFAALGAGSLVCVSGGTGIAPMVACVRKALQQNLPCRLLCAYHDVGDILLAAELEPLARAGRITLQYCLSVADPPLPPFAVAGRISEACTALSPLPSCWAGARACRSGRAGRGWNARARVWPAGVQCGHGGAAGHVRRGSRTRARVCVSGDGRQYKISEGLEDVVRVGGLRAEGGGLPAAQLCGKAAVWTDALPSLAEPVKRRLACHAARRWARRWRCNEGWRPHRCARISQAMMAEALRLTPIVQCTSTTPPAAWAVSAMN